MSILDTLKLVQARLNDLGSELVLLSQALEPISKPEAEAPPTPKAPAPCDASAVRIALGGIFENIREQRKFVVLQRKRLEL